MKELIFNILKEEIQEKKELYDKERKEIVNEIKEVSVSYHLLISLFLFSFLFVYFCLINIHSKSLLKQLMKNHLHHLLKYINVVQLDFIDYVKKMVVCILN